ncbi:hypothetical protein Marky_1893 [Marinithermus hydrothermalis DSM 14884]|uniref:Uncharacterized protein n=1 Tax=Marinithermus hydrothermalis (strain DSM 14884 / JCM 11576 / T1) TaxID=869210 RepID=F2NKG4_MARHT|nr:hypothetical protein Marky_1893 [Marinithermus hydrothermalis DSM 14884]
MRWIVKRKKPYKKPRARRVVCRIGFVRGQDRAEV